LVDDYKKEMSKNDAAYIEIQEQLKAVTHGYHDLSVRLDRKYKKAVYVKTVKGVIDVILLPTDTLGVGLIVSTGLALLEKKLYDPKYIPLGVKYDSKEVIDSRKFFAELNKENKILTEILNSPIKSETQFLTNLRNGELQAIKCQKISNKLCLKFRKIEPQALTNRKAILKYLTDAAREVDTILAKKANISGCKISPDPVVLTSNQKKLKLEVIIGYDTGLRKPAKPTDVIFKSDDTTTVEVDQQGMLIGLKTGSADVTVNVKKGGRPCWVTVEVDFQTVPGKKASVPDVIGKDKKTAEKEIKKAGLKMSIKTAPKMNKSYPPETVILQSPKANSLVDLGTAVSITMNPPSLVPPAELLAIILEGDPQPPYLVNKQFSLAAVAKFNPKNQYTFTWYINDRKIGQGQSVKYVFPDAGTYTIKVVMDSSDPGEDSELEKQIRIGVSNVDFSFSPKLDKGKTYKEGDTVTFTENCKNIKNITEYRWYINGKDIGSGKRVTHTFNEQGTYKIKLGLRMGSNYDEIKHTKSITIGSGIGVLGNPNRFKARGGPENLSVCSEYWVGGIGEWSSKCKEVSKIGPVDGYDLCTGDQSEGWNTGFLVYSKKGSEKLSFQVYHFKFGNKWKGVIHYSGEIQKAINPDPESITISCRANVATVRWTNEDGSVCSTKIWKFKYSTVLAHYGIEQSTCSEPLVEPTKLKRCKTFAKRAVEQFNENLNRKCNLQGPEWHGDEEGHKQWCLNVSKKEAGSLTRHRDNALKNCGKTWCDSYAKRAVEQNEENIRNQCRFSGRRWQSVYNNHYNWCRNTTKRSSDSEIKKRDIDLQNCIRVREGPCKRYAEKAVKQNGQNIQKDCGFCGQRWQSSFDNHFQWCLEQPQSARDSETKARQNLLNNKCKDVSSAGERRFYEPCYNGYRLDNCLNFGTNCEEPAANKFCEEKGFTKATSWKLEKARPTYTIGDHSLCDDDFCAGFEYITCSGYKYPDNINPVCTIKRPKSGVIVQPGKYVGFRADASDPDYKGYRLDHLNYAWVFEGGRPDKWESWQGSATAQWNTPGTFTATLTVTDDKGGTCTDTVVITVQDKGGTLDCDQYADKSVRQNEENLSKKCGFTGDLWHSNKSGHTHWCQNANQIDAAQNIATREKALTGCKGPSTVTDLVCDITAPSGIAFINAGKTIDFAGSAQSPSGSSLSYNWKFGEYGAEPGTSTKQNPGKVVFKWGGSYKATLTVTDARGKTCQATRHVLVYDSNDPCEFCEGYAGISIEQNEENKRNNCGYSGEHWHDDEFNHQKWCKSVSLDQARAGLMDRDEKLRKCTGKTVITQPPQQPPDIKQTKSTFSCANKDNEEKGCCCFMGAHTYRFDSRHVTTVLARFDTGKRFNCRSTVNLDVDRGNGWETIKTVQANSSREGSEVAPTDVLVPVNSTIEGFRISDGCVCCIDSSEIRLNGGSSGGTGISTGVGTGTIGGTSRLGPVADSRVYAYAYRNWNKANWGAYNIFTAGWHPVGGESRAYLKFDLSGIDPKSVDKATLRLFHYHTGGNNSLSLGVHRVTGTWQEGGGTYHSGKVEKPAAPGEISWVNQPSFDPRPLAYFNPGPGVNKWVEVDITPLVKQWLSGVPNNGLVLKATGNLTHNTPISVYGFYSREDKDKSKHPVLVLSGSSWVQQPDGGLGKDIALGGGVEDLGCEEGAAPPPVPNGQGVQGIASSFADKEQRRTEEVGGREKQDLYGRPSLTGTRMTQDELMKKLAKMTDEMTLKPTVGKKPSGKALTDITVNSRKITISFWDHGKEDGDIIDILLNGKVLRDGIVLTKAPQSFTVNLQGGKNVFGVRAVNEGSISPNTATVKFSNVTQGKDVQVYEIKSGQKTDMNIKASKFK
jgi:hypothetical protein